MSALGDRMALIASTLAARYPARVVTRSFQQFEQRKREDLIPGIYTIVSRGEGGYANYNGREAMDGNHKILVIGQIVLEESQTPAEVEDAEFVMVEEIKALVRDLPSALCSLVMMGFDQSGQLLHPYGGITVELEMTA
jgi:hypothetical protein